ncbi:MAG: electron transfer flavoprotein subunit beta/FixA family protein [Candidatus Binatia bacterium]|nr:electron transfer flavoprotein subunit beta/FixA family protein [Candidatus Binatia bacterium]
MKILVPIKRVPDPQTNIVVKPDGSGIAEDNVKFVINPFCEIAIEEALRIKENQGEAEVILISIGDAVCQEQLRTGLAMGADRAILVVADKPLDPATTTEVLAKIVADEQPELVMLGKQSIDDDANQTGQLLASTLDWPQATFASKVEFSDDKADVTVTREVDGGLEEIAFSLPGIITTDLRLNEPRYASLPGIMKARKKELKEIPLAEAGASDSLQVETLTLVPPSVREAGKTVETVDELVELLHSEAKLI